MALAIANDDLTNSLPRWFSGVDDTTFTVNTGGPSDNGIYTPGANSLLVALVGGGGLGSDPTSLTGHGISYSKVAAATTTSLGRLHVYVADSGGSPTNAALSGTWPTTATGFAAYDVEVTGADLSAGAVASILQAPTDQQAAGTSISSTLVAAGDAANRPMTVLYIDKNEAITLDGSYPALHDAGHASPNRRLSVGFQPDGFDTAITNSWTTTGIGRQYTIEIKAITTVLDTALIVAANAFPIEVIEPVPFSPWDHHQDQVEHLAPPFVEPAIGQRRIVVKNQASRRSSRW